MEKQVTSHEKSCGIIIFHNKDFLLLHYPEGHWDFVKGHVEKGESEIDTALRELKEETGIKHVEIKKDFREDIHYFFTKKGKLVSKKVIFLLGEVNDKEVEISHEHQNFEWMPFKEAYNRVTFKNAKELLQKAYNFLV